MKRARKAPARRIEDERWNRDIATLRQAAHELVQRRSERRLRLANSPFEQIAQLLDDPSAKIREKAVRHLYEMDPDRAATLVNDALRDGSPEERRRIGSALAGSGLLYEAIDDLMAENHESCYGAFSLLFLVAKAGVVEPLSSVVERLSANNSLAPELRSAVTEAITHLATRGT